MFVRGSCNKLSSFSFYFFGSPLSPSIRLFRVPLLARSIFFYIFSFNHYTDVCALSSFTCSVRTFCFARLATLANVVPLTPARWNIIYHARAVFFSTKRTRTRTRGHTSPAYTYTHLQGHEKRTLLSSKTKKNGAIKSRD